MTEETKRGARNNRMDRQTIQQMHDASVMLGAMCMDDEKSIDPEEMLVAFGNEIKVLDEGNGKVKVGGYLVRFGSDNDTDLTLKDFFDAQTDFGVEFPSKSLTWFNHRQPVTVTKGTKKKQVYIPDQFEPAVLTRDDIGIFFEGVLDERKEYDAMLIELARIGKLGLSSGTAPHLVKRSPMPNGTSHIDMWVLGLDASYTHRPAEYRNAVVPLKSLITPHRDEAAATDKPDGETKTTPIQEKFTMNDEEKKAFSDEVKSAFAGLKEELKEEVKDVATKAAQEVIANLPEVKNAMNIQVTRDEADTPFKSIAENLLAVRDLKVNGEVSAVKQFPRVRFLKATGASEGVPQDGGLLLDPTLTSEIIKPMHEDGPFSSAIRWLPVSGNSNYGWINGVDETSRVTGSRWGGIRGYRIAEAATKTASKPTFRRINWELKEYAAVVVATDPLLADAAQFSEIVRTGVTEELSFMLNEDIYDGAGLAGPQGFMSSGAMITVTRTDASKILGSDISNMWVRMDLRGRKNATWYVSNDAGPQLDNLFAVGSTSVLYPYATIGADGVKRLYGRPIVTTEFNETLGTAGDITLCDMSQYLGWQKGGIEESTSIHVYFLSDETAFRFVYRVDGKSSVNTALTPLKGTTTTSPFVRLLATS